MVAWSRGCLYEGLGVDCYTRWVMVLFSKAKDATTTVIFIGKATWEFHNPVCKWHTTWLYWTDTNES